MIMSGPWPSAPSPRYIMSYAPRCGIPPSFCETPLAHFASYTAKHVMMRALCIMLPAIKSRSKYQSSVSRDAISA